MHMSALNQISRVVDGVMYSNLEYIYLSNWKDACFGGKMSYYEQKVNVGLAPCGGLMC